MSTGLDAVYVELKRLQLEGMDRVFIQDSTLALLTPAKPRIPQKPATPAHPTPAIDLQSAVQSGTKPDTPAPKSASKRPAEAMVNPLPEAPTIELPDGDASSRMQWLKEQVETSPVCQEHLRKYDLFVFS